jgi:hypothetical protein
MIDRIIIECTPVMEDCVQVGDPNYEMVARLEAETFREQLFRTWKDNKRVPVPNGLKINVKRNRHDFGVYYSIEIVYDDQDHAEEQAAYWFEENQPEYWDFDSKNKLGRQTYALQ